jgi:hypothetical protein
MKVGVNVPAGLVATGVAVGMVQASTRAATRIRKKIF